MKERIVITQDWLVKDMKAGVPELDKLFICQKVEQVPESFAELKELCKDIKEVTITEEGHINVGLVYFTKGGEIYAYVEGLLTSSVFLPVSKDRTPQQMWGIIKNLIGEQK